MHIKSTAAENHALPRTIGRPLGEGSVGDSGLSAGKLALRTNKDEDRTIL
jgi:hypothetical protein